MHQDLLGPELGTLRLGLSGGPHWKFHQLLPQSPWRLPPYIHPGNFRLQWLLCSGNGGSWRWKCGGNCVWSIHHLPKVILFQPVPTGIRPLSVSKKQIWSVVYSNLRIPRHLRACLAPMKKAKKKKPKSGRLARADLIDVPYNLTPSYLESWNLFRLSSCFGGLGILSYLVQSNLPLGFLHWAGHFWFPHLWSLCLWIWILSSFFLGLCCVCPTRSYPCPGSSAGDLDGASSALSGWWKSGKCLRANATELGADKGEFCLKLEVVPSCW